MTQHQRSRYLICNLTACIAIITVSISAKNYTLAQVTPDFTLGRENSVVTPNTIINGVRSDRIDGGAIRGANLFHSFQEFNIGEGQGAYFTNPSGIQNIFSRVTDRNNSQILGKLGVLGGNANLFLINPNGIIFGSKASLDLRSSFVATTANSIQFENQGFFNSSIPNVPPILTVNPSAFLFNQVTASITNSSQEPAGQRLTLLNPSEPSEVKNLFGLRVPDGRSLLLLGGDVSLNNGGLNALGGRIEVIGVAGVGRVGLDINGQSLHLSFANDTALANISLSDGARLDASSEGGGDIQVQGRNITLNNNSQLISSTLGVKPGGDLLLSASDSIRLIGSLPEGVLSTLTSGTGNAGDIVINTNRLIVQDGAQITTLSLQGGSGGRIQVHASESVELTGTSLEGINSGLFSVAIGSGKAGDITIDTEKLVVRDGAFISTESSGSDFGTFIPAEGAGGNLTINASKSVQLFGLSSSGQSSGLSAQSSGVGNAGNLTINTEQLLVRDGAEIDVISEGIGNAGNLGINAGTISLDNGGKLRATSRSGTGGGNIFVQGLNSLILRRNSEISTSAGGEGNGGNISIQTNLLMALENSKITATAIRGKGGNIRIRTQGLIVSPNRDSQIDASSDEGIDGVVEINRLENDLGNALLTLPAEPVDISGLIAQGCSSGEGSIARRGSEFVVTGRGGLPPNPQQAISSDFALADLGKPIQAQTTQAKVVVPNKQNTSASTAIVEAQGWIIDDRGKVILTASAPNVTPSIPWMQPNSCHNNS